MTPKGVFNHWSGKKKKHEDDVPYISAPIEILENVNVSPIYRRCELEVRGSNPLGFHSSWNFPF